jgi:hypothetical protein
MMDSTRKRLSRLGGAAAIACLITAVVGLWTSYSAGTSMGSLALVVVLLDRGSAPPGARSVFYGLIIFLCIALTTFMLQRALAGSAA